MSDPRDYPYTSPHKPREESEPVGWMPMAIAAGIIAVIVMFAIMVPPDQKTAVRTDQPGIATDLDTTGRALPKQ